jgi:hypothetical protein
MWNLAEELFARADRESERPIESIAVQGINLGRWNLRPSGRYRLVGEDSPPESTERPRRFVTHGVDRTR